MHTETDPTRRPDQNAPGEPVDTSDMATIHSFYRRELRLASGVVRAVAADDVRRARVVAEHLDFVSRSLHHHHLVEDELLWPLLSERVPEQLLPLVRLMEHQHARVDTLLASVSERAEAWRRSADAAGRDALADLLDALYAAVSEHLDAEEERLLPLAARSLTPQEWRTLGQEGKARTRRSELTLSLGMFQYEGDPVVLDRMLAGVPAGVRWLLPRLARRAFRRHATRVHGTPTP